MSDALEGTRIGSDSLYDFKQTGAAEAQGKLKATRLGELDDFEKSLGLSAPEYTSTAAAEPAPSKPNYGGAPGKPLVARPKRGRLPDNPTMEDALGMVQDLEVGDVVEGIVTRLENGGVYIDFKYKSEGFIPLVELNPGETIEVGQTVSGMIGHLESKEGYTILSKRRADEELAWRDLNRAYKRKESVEADVIGTVSGGLVVEIYHIRAFIPASHVLKGSSDSLDEFLNTRISAKVIQLDRRRRKVVLSHKLAAHAAGASKEQAAAIEKIQVGQTIHGKVTSIKDFGAFVDVGGVEGLVHISEMSWKRIEHPTEMLSAGQEIDVFVLGVDPETRKISLGMKQLQQDPWVSIAEKYAVGSLVKGTVSRIVTFGAFVKLEDNIEGLVHISEIAEQRIQSAADVLKPGQAVEARVLRVIPEEQKIGLSIKAVNDTRASNPSQGSANARANVSSEGHVPDKQLADALRQAQSAVTSETPA